MDVDVFYDDVDEENDYDDDDDDAGMIMMMFYEMICYLTLLNNANEHRLLFMYRNKHIVLI